MQARHLALAFALISTAISSAAVRGETQRALPVTVVPGIANLDSDRVVFSAAGQFIATIDGGYGIKLWEAASGRLLRALNDEAYFISVALSPDGKWMASGHKDGKIKLWDTASGRVTATLTGKPTPDGDADQVASLWLTANNDVLISGGRSGLITVWDVAKRVPLRSFIFAAGAPVGSGSAVIAMRLTVDQKTLIATTEASVKTFEFANGKELSAFDLPNAPNMWSAKDRSVFFEDSIVDDDSLMVRFTAGCKVDELRFVSLKNTSEIISVDKPEKCEEPDEKATIGQPTVFVNSSRSAVIIERSGIAEFKQWDLRSRSVTRVVKWTDGGDLLGLDGDFKLALRKKVGAGVGIVQFDTGAPVRDLMPPWYPAETPIISRDGRHVLLSHEPDGAGRKGKDATMWQFGTMTPVSVRLAADKETVFRDFAPEAKLALAIGEKGDVILCSTETGSELRRFSVEGLASVYKARLSPDGKLIALKGASEDDQAIAVLIDAGDGKIKHRFGGSDERGGVVASTGKDDESDFVSAMEFSPDSKSLAVGRWNGTAEIWDTKTLKRLKALPAAKEDSDQIWSLAFAPDGRKLVAGSRNSGAFLWDLSAARPARSFVYEGLAGHAHVASVALSHDGATIAGGLGMHAVSSGDVGLEHSIKVWNASTGKLRFTIRGHDGGVESLTFSPDDRWIISASFDGTVRYWNSATGQWAATFTVTRDGRWIVNTEGGLFAGAAGVDNLVGVVRGLKSQPASGFHDQLFRPDLVQLLLNGDRDGRYRAAVRQLDLSKTWDANAPR